MSLLYSDNSNRRARVENLVLQCVMFQDQMKDTNNKWKNHDTRAYSYLEKVAKAANFPSPQDFVNNALALLTPEERQKWEAQRKKANTVDADLAKSMDVLGVVLGIVIGSEVVATKTVSSFGKAIFGAVGRLIGFRAIATAVAQNIEVGEKASALADLVEEAFKVKPNELNAVKEAGIVEDAAGMEKMVNEAASAGVEVEVAADATEAVKAAAAAGTEAKAVSGPASCLKVGARVFNVVALLATIGILIYEGVEGAKQKEELHGHTVEYFAKRYSIKLSQLKLDKAFINMTDMQKLIVDEDALNDLVKDGTITEDQKKAKMQKYVQGLKGIYQASFSSLKEQDVVDALTAIDKNQNAWTNEDPSMDEAKQWLKDHPNPPPEPTKT